LLFARQIFDSGLGFGLTNPKFKNVLRFVLANPELKKTLGFVLANPKFKLKGDYFPAQRLKISAAFVPPNPNELESA
jgi:hypothetical protein